MEGVEQDRSIRADACEELRIRANLRLHEGKPAVPDHAQPWQCNPIAEQAYREHALSSQYLSDAYRNMLFVVLQVYEANSLNDLNARKIAPANNAEMIR